MASFATPSIELKKRIGARKKSKNPEKKTDKNRHISKTARIPIGKLRAARGCQSPDRDSGNRKVGEKTLYVKYLKNLIN